MLMTGQIAKIKQRADEKWLNAIDLEAADYEPQEIDTAFEKAFEDYQTVYELLQNESFDFLAKEKINPENHPEIINLYYIYKTLATAYFDMGEYETAATLYRQAFELHANHPTLFTLEVDNQEIQALHYNEALARLYAIQESQSEDLKKAEIENIGAVFLKELCYLRSANSEGYLFSKVMQQLLLCKQLISKTKTNYHSELDKQKLKWAFSQIFTQEQINSLIFSANELNLGLFSNVFEFLEASLTEKQKRLIEKFSPEKMPVISEMEKMLQNITAFKKTNEFKKLKLYPYQDEALTSFENHIRAGKNKGFYTAATGTGKTRIFISQALATNVKTIILVPSISLATQTKNRLMDQLEELGIKKSVGVFADGEKSKGDIVIMTYNSLKSELNKSPSRRALNLKNYPLVILDEVHLSLTEKANEIVQMLATDKVVIGCTATEEYNTKRPRGALKSVSELFGDDNCFFKYPIDKAIEEGSLSPVHICMVTTDTSLRWKRDAKKKKGGQKEISEKDAAELINKDKLNTVVAEIYANSVYPNTGKRLFGKQAVAFCAGVEHAKAVALKFNELFKNNDYFKQKGITPAAYISGDLDGKEQKKILEDYCAGKIALLCGSDLLITGIDNPNICAVFNLRPTRSIVMALQRGGRAVRLSKDMPEKVALIFEFNWVVDGQVFLDEFLGGRHQLGKLPEVKDENINLQVLRREEVATRFDGGGAWELDWTGEVRKRSVRTTKDKEIKVAAFVMPEKTITPIPPVLSQGVMDSLNNILNTQAAKPVQSSRYPLYGYSAQPKVPLLYQYSAVTSDETITPFKLDHDDWTRDAPKGSEWNLFDDCPNEDKLILSSEDLLKNDREYDDFWDSIIKGPI